MLRSVGINEKIKWKQENRNEGRKISKKKRTNENIWIE